MIIDCVAHEDQRPPLLYHVNYLIFPLSFNRCLCSYWHSNHFSIRLVQSHSISFRHIICLHSFPFCVKAVISVRIRITPHLKQFSFVSKTFSFRIHHPLKLFAQKHVQKPLFVLCQTLIYIESQKIGMYSMRIHSNRKQHIIKHSRQNGDKFYAADLMPVCYAKWSTISRIKKNKRFLNSPEPINCLMASFKSQFCGLIHHNPKERHLSFFEQL